METTNTQFFAVTEQEYLSLRNIVRTIVDMQVGSLGPTPELSLPPFIVYDSKVALIRKYSSIHLVFAREPERDAQFITMLATEFWIRKQVRNYIIERYERIHLSSSIEQLGLMLTVMKAIREYANEYISRMEQYEQIVISYFEHGKIPDIALKDLDIKPSNKLKKLYKSEFHWLSQLKKMRAFVETYEDNVEIINRLIRFPGISASNTNKGGE